MKNWFATLNESLESEGLVEVFPIGHNLNYDQTIRLVVDGLFISVYRNERGMYERPISYASKCENFVSFC